MTLTSPDLAGVVLVTRPEPGASETAARLAAMSLRPLLAPMLTVRPQTARLPPSGAVQAILITSGNALGALPEAHRSLPMFAVGARTAERARQSAHVTVTAASGDAASLCELVCRRLRPQDGPLLLATATGQGEGLAESLRRQGFRVLRRTVYAATPVRALPASVGQALAEGRVRAALFFSAATARAFSRALHGAGAEAALAAVEAIAIAPSTAAILSPLPWRRVRVAVRPTQDDMLALLR